MKRPACWAEKTAPRKLKGIKGQLLTCLLLSPMKCQHCYHKFLTFLPRTWGLTPPDAAGTGINRLRIVGSLESYEQDSGNLPSMAEEDRSDFADRAEEYPETINRSGESSRRSPS